MKFTYYDIFSNLIPGIFFLWSLMYLEPFFNYVYSGVQINNIIIDSIFFIVLVYVIGLILQFMSKCTVEPFIKWIFWKRHFFSEMYLVDVFNKCSEVDLNRFRKCAKEKLGFTDEDLLSLSDKDILKDNDKLTKALDVSQSIYRSIDAKTNDDGKAQKAHFHNVFYSLFRNISASFLTMIILNLAYMIYFQTFDLMVIGLTILNIILFLVCLERAREKGEGYVKGLFWSYC